MHECRLFLTVSFFTVSCSTSGNIFVGIKVKGKHSPPHLFLQKDLKILFIWKIILIMLLLPHSLMRCCAVISKSLADIFLAIHFSIIVTTIVQLYSFNSVKVIFFIKRTKI